MDQKEPLPTTLLLLGESSMSAWLPQHPPERPREEGPLPMTHPPAPMILMTRTSPTFIPSTMENDCYVIILTARISYYTH